MGLGSDLSGAMETTGTAPPPPPDTAPLEAPPPAQDGWGSDDEGDSATVTSGAGGSRVTFQFALSMDRLEV